VRTETATDSGLLVDHHYRLDRRDQFAIVASAIWMISRSRFSSMSAANDLRLMTRAGLEPATYGLKERVLIVVLASLSMYRL
jgi:hypothetical protein